jgi:hypothetical protein
VDHLERYFFDIIKLFAIDRQAINPSPAKLTQTLLDILLSRANGVLPLLGLEEVADEGLSNSHDLPIHLIAELPLILRKHA